MRCALSSRTTAQWACSTSPGMPAASTCCSDRRSSAGRSATATAPMSAKPLGPAFPRRSSRALERGLGPSSPRRPHSEVRGSSAAIAWLEGRLWEVLNVAPAAELLDQVRPGDESLPPWERAELKRYITPVTAVLARARRQPGHARPGATGPACAGASTHLLGDGERPPGSGLVERGHAPSPNLRRIRHARDGSRRRQTKGRRRHLRHPLGGCRRRSRPQRERLGLVGSSLRRRHPRGTV